MRFLLDQDVYALTARFLRAAGHDVVTVAELGRSRGEDSEHLKTARELERIFVTRDRDFGSLVFVEGLRTGILYLRLTPATLSSVHEELASILASYPEEVLRAAFVVVGSGRHRLRKRPPAGR